MHKRSIVLGLVAVGFVALVGLALWLILLGPFGHSATTADDDAITISESDAKAAVDPAPQRNESSPGPLPSTDEDPPAAQRGTEQAEAVAGRAPADDETSGEAQEEQSLNVEAEGEWHGEIRLRGEVRYGDTGDPVTAVILLALSPQAEPEPARTATAEPNEQGEFKASFADVTFSLEALHAAVRIELAGEHDNDTHLRPTQGEIPWHAELATTLDTDSVLELGTIFLWDTLGEATVHGRIRSARTGGPIADAQVALHDTMQRTTEHSSRVLAVAATDEEGRYRFEGLRPGRLSVTARAAEYASASTPVERMAAGETLELDLTLEGQRVLRGYVVEAETAEPLAGAFVGAAAQPEPHALADFTVSAADGSFELGGLGPGGWMLFAELEGYASAFEMFSLPAQEQEPEPVTLELRSGRMLHGRVVDAAGQPVERYVVRAWAQPEPGPQALQEEAYAQMLGPSERIEDSEGRFTLGPLPEEGPHTVEVIGGASHARTLKPNVQIGPTMREIEVVLTEGATLSGKIRFESLAGSGEEEETEEPLAGARIALMRTIGGTEESPEYPFEESRELLTYSAGNGEYRLSGLPAGRLHLRVTHAEFAPHDFTVELSPGEKTRHDVTFAGEEASLFGYARDSEGEPVGGRYVLAQEMGGERRYDTTTDAEGHFDFGTVPPGTYLVMMLCVTFQSVEFSRTVSVEAGEVREVELVPPADAVELTGQVSQHGEPVPGISLLLTPLEASHAEQMVVGSTDRNGRYTLHVRPGRYTLLVQREAPPLFFRVELEVPAVPRHSHDIEIPTLTLVGQLLDASANRPMDPGVELVLEPVREEPAGAMSGFADLFARYAGQMRTLEEGGRFRWEGIAPGRYHLRAYADGYGLAIVENLDLRGEGEVEVPTIYFETQASLRLTVRNMGDEPVSGATLTITDSRGRNLTLIDSMHTAANGEAYVPFLHPEERYTIRVHAPGYAPAQTSYEPAGTLQGELAVTLTPGGALEVEVVDRHGEPVEGAEVRLYDAADEFVPPRYTHAQMFSSPGHTNVSGRVRRDTLAPGSYTVRAHHEGRSAEQGIDVRPTGPGAAAQTLRLRLQE